MTSASGAQGPQLWQRLRALRFDAVIGCAGVAAVVVLHMRDPHIPGAYGVCPFHAATRLWCPGCGGLRAINDLTYGNVLAALHSNVLVVPMGLGAASLWGQSMLRRWRGDRRPRGYLDSTAVAALVALLIAFTVVRNTSWGARFAPE